MLNHPCLVAEIMLAGPERRAQLMRETHGERRRWISEDNPTIVDILTKFNVFLRFPEEVSVYKLTTLPYHVSVDSRSRF